MAELSRNDAITTLIGSVGFAAKQVTDNPVDEHIVTTVGFNAILSLGVTVPELIHAMRNAPFIELGIDSELQLMVLEDSLKQDGDGR
jgi:hypothetical protein